MGSDQTPWWKVSTYDGLVDELKLAGFIWNEHLQSWARGSDDALIYDESVRGICEYWKGFVPHIARAIRAGATNFAVTPTMESDDHLASLASTLSFRK